MPESMTVTQLNTRVNDLLKGSNQVRDVWVSGEISGLKKYPSGHYYFTLKDGGSAISCTLFAFARKRLNFEPRDNMKVEVFGGVNVYVPKGTYQFNVETMRESGVGDLYRQFEEMKRKLEAEGLFSQERKCPLPPYPKVIGVVTSEAGAVIHDIITTSASRFPADILLAPSLVQGEGAAENIVAGIELLNRVGYVDVIIVGRGGGSMEDLWPFNEEIVARAIAASKIPIVSAVGHETDFTIADFVADVRAPTPTGAAALILRDRTEIRNQIEREMNNAGKALRSVVERMRGRFGILDAKLSPERAIYDLNSKEMILDEMGSRADRCLSDRMNGMQHRFELIEARLTPKVLASNLQSECDGLDELWGRMDRAMLLNLSQMSHRLEMVDVRMNPEDALKDIDLQSSKVDSLFGKVSVTVSERLALLRASAERSEAKLESLNPLKVLDRGYGMVVGTDGKAVTSVSSIMVGEKLDVRFRDGMVKTIVREVKEDRR